MGRLGALLGLARLRGSGTLLGSKRLLGSRLLLGWGLVLGSGLAALPVAAADARGAEPVIYKWVDQNGIAHYTTDPDRVPAVLRNRIRRLTRDRAPAAAPGDAPESGVPPASEAWVREEAPQGEVPGGVGSALPRAPASAAGEPELDARIAALEAEIARDEERLKTLISAPARSDSGVLADDPEFREVAGRLPRLQADLRALRARREDAARPQP